jgi:hypothetical protein
MRVRWLSATLLLVLMGCGGTSSLSGTYMATDSGAAAMLQLTENQSHQLLGSILFVTLQPNGGLEKRGANITGGSTDGSSLTVTVKASQLFSQPENVGGRVVSGGIDLTFGTVIAHFAPASPQAFDAAVNALAATGQEQQRRRGLAQLTHDLDAYCAKMDAHPITRERAHDEEQKLVAAAQHDLTVERQLRPQSFQAGQVRYRISNLDFQLGQIGFQVERAEPVWHAEIQRLDARVASNPCHSTKDLPGCNAFAAADQRYASVRTQVLSDATQVEADLRQSQSEMTALNQEAGN